MTNSPLLRPQPPVVLRIAGIVAFLTGIAGLAICGWLYLHDRALERGSVVIYTAGGLVSLYSLVIAHRLLFRQPDQRHLLSPSALVVMGVYLGGGALVELWALHDPMLTVVGLALAFTAVSLGIRRLRDRDAT